MVPSNIKTIATLYRLIPARGVEVVSKSALVGLLNTKKEIIRNESQHSAVGIETNVPNGIEVYDGWKIGILSHIGQSQSLDRW